MKTTTDKIQVPCKERLPSKKGHCQTNDSTRNMGQFYFYDLKKGKWFNYCGKGAKEVFPEYWIEEVPAFIITSEELEARDKKIIEASIDEAEEWDGYEFKHREVFIANVLEKLRK